MTAAADELAALLGKFDRNAHQGGDLSLGPVRGLLARLGRPQERFPPVIHIAGTNGKGSTAAFIRAMAEAAGLSVHVSTSPHLVRINERVRLAGSLIDDTYFLDCAQRAAAAAEGHTVSYFELTFAAAALAFAETPADLLILEVGLGGRLDATNVVDHPAVTVITPIAFDHMAILGRTIARIAFEKAGIIKQGCPVVSALQHSDAAGVIAEEAFARSAPLHLVSPDEVKRITSPIGLAGSHQKANAALAVKALKVWGHPAISNDAIVRGIGDVVWPARMQKLRPGPLTDRCAGRDVWLDGGHNAHAATAVSDVLTDLGGRTALVLSLLEGKDAHGYIEALGNFNGRLIACPNAEGHAGCDPAALAAIARSNGLRAEAANTFDDAIALAVSGAEDRVLICGSLYLAGYVLRRNNELPI